MDLAGQELHVFASISSAAGTRNRAKALIGLAESNPNHADTLAACATVLLAAALEQAVQSVLSMAAETVAFDKDFPVSETEPALYHDATLWWRVQQLPSVLSEGRFRLQHNHKLTKALGELIKTRNKLVHVNEPAHHLIGPNDQIKIENGRVKVNIKQSLNPWGSVKLEQAKTYEAAVGAYFSEVLFPESGQMKNGIIITARR